MAQYNFYVDGTEVDFSDWEIPNDQVAKTVAELFAWDMSVRVPREIAFNLTVKRRSGEVIVEHTRMWVH